MARRHIRKDVSGKGWKHTQALKTGASGHVKNPRVGSDAPAPAPVEAAPPPPPPKPEPEPEPEPVIEEVEVDLTEVEEEKPKKGRWGRSKKSAKKKSTKDD